MIDGAERSTGDIFRKNKGLSDSTNERVAGFNCSGYILRWFNKCVQNAKMGCRVSSPGLKLCAFFDFINLNVEQSHCRNVT